MSWPLLHMNSLLLALVGDECALNGAYTDTTAAPEGWGFDPFARIAIFGVTIVESSM